MELLDPQFDEKFVGELGINHDITDVPRDRFWTAATAWRACRSGEADPMEFGIEFTGMRGLWFVAGSLVRDLATLNSVEVLPWDVRGKQPPPDADISEEDPAWFDDIAELTADPDTNHEEIRRRFATDEELTVPPTVFNSVLQCRDLLPPGVTAQRCRRFDPRLRRRSAFGSSVSRRPMSANVATSSVWPWSSRCAWIQPRPARSHRRPSSAASSATCQRGDSYRYLAGVEVSVGATVREPLQVIRVPARSWAMVTHREHITTITSTIQAVFAEALPAAGLVPGDDPDLLEVYRETFDPWSGLGGVELWVPLRDR